MSYQKLIKQLELEEGRRYNAYLCTAGHRTIGVGHNLDAKPDYLGSQIPSHITDAEMDAILLQDIIEVTEALEKRCKGFNLLTGARRDAIIQMAFQLGVNGLLGFKKMLDALIKQDWRKAYDEALNSGWAKQTPARAQRVAKQLLTGVYYG